MPSVTHRLKRQTNCSLMLLAMSASLFVAARASADDAQTDAKPNSVDSKTAVEKKSSEPVLLRYHFHSNQFLHYKVVQEMIIQMQAAETEEVTKNKAISKQHLRIISVDGEGNAVMEAMLDHVRMEYQFDDNTPTEFDSGDSNKQPEQFAHIMKSIGKPQGRVRVNPLGKVLPYDEIQQSGNNDDPEEKSQRLEAYSLLVPLPEEPVRIGEKWTDYLDINVRIDRQRTRTLRVRRAYELKSIEDNIAVIDFNSVILENPQDPEIRAQLIQRSPSGSIRFNIAEGKIVSKTLSSDKTEHGIAGDASRMRAVSHRTETLFNPK